jgi:hypothetical protein
MADFQPTPGCDGTQHKDLTVGGGAEIVKGSQVTVRSVFILQPQRPTCFGSTFRTQSILARKDIRSSPQHIFGTKWFSAFLTRYTPPVLSKRLVRSSGPPKIPDSRRSRTFSRAIATISTSFRRFHTARWNRLPQQRLYIHLAILNTTNPHRYQAGVGGVIKGWDQGCLGKNNATAQLAKTAPLFAFLGIIPYVSLSGQPMRIRASE